MFASRVNLGWDFTGRTITQAADIDMAGLPWGGIGTAENPFRGTFNGNGYRLLNLTAQNGLFIFVHSGTIQNVHVTNVNINNLTTTATTNSVSSVDTGVIVASHGLFTSGALRIQNCTVNGGTIRGQGHVGGIIGRSDNTVTITGCSVRASLTSSTGTADGDIAVGGIAGSLVATDSSISTSFLNGSVEGTTSIGSKSVFVGGMVGQIDGNVRDCFAGGAQFRSTTSTNGVAVVAGIVGRILGEGIIIERNYVTVSSITARSPTRAYACGLGFIQSSIRSSGTFRNNAIEVHGITALDATAARVVAEVGCVFTTSGSSITAQNNHKINTLFPSGQPATTPASITGLSRPIATTSQLATWFQSQTNYTTAANWTTDGTWNFTSNWIMSNNPAITDPAVRAITPVRPYTRAYVNNVVNFQPKAPASTPDCPTTPLLAQITALTNERNQLAERLEAEEGKLKIANDLITTLTADLAKARANECTIDCIPDPHECPPPEPCNACATHVCPPPVDCENCKDHLCPDPVDNCYVCTHHTCPPLEDCVNCENHQCPACDTCIPCSTACQDVLVLETKVKEYQTQIANITETIGEMLQQDQGKEGDMASLLSELRAMMEALQAQTPDPNPNTIDIWLFVSIGLALVCVTMLVTMIILSRRKMNVSLVQLNAGKKKT